jgi:hypothetical protein
MKLTKVYIAAFILIFLVGSITYVKIKGSEKIPTFSDTPYNKEALAEYDSVQRLHVEKEKSFQSLWENPEFFPDELVYGYDWNFDVQNFLKKMNHWLADFTYEDRLASYYITRYCRKYGINQRYILARMQYEQSIFSSTLQDGKYKYAYLTKKQRSQTFVTRKICGYVGGDGPNDPQYYGFEKQVRLCAYNARHRYKEGKVKLNKLLLLQERREGGRKWSTPTKEELASGVVKAVYPKSISAHMLFRYSDKPKTLIAFKYIYKKWFPKQYDNAYKNMRIKWGLK